MNGLLNLIAVILIIGVLLGIAYMMLPLPGFVRMLLNIVVAVILIIFILEFFGIIPTVIPIPKLF